MIFNSKKGSSGFALINSKDTADENFTIRIKEENQFLRSHVYAKIKHGQIETDGMTDKNGIISFPRQMVDSIILLLEFCPDKFFTYVIKNKNHNNFEFIFDKDIMEVFFEGLTLILNKENELVGQHPLLTRYISVCKELI